MEVRGEVYRPEPARDRAEATPVSGPVHQAAARPPVAREADPVEVPAEARPDVARRAPRPERRHRTSVVVQPGSHVADVAARSLCLLRCGGQAFAVRPRLGAAYLSRTGTSMGLLDVGMSLGYVLDPRISLELRGDFLIPFTGDRANDLDSVWLSLNLIWVFVDGRVVWPYLIVGVDLAVMPGDRASNLATLVAGGGQAGLGVEVALGRFVALNFEVVGVVSGAGGEVIEAGVNATAAVSFYF
jgi:hypothetical protein